MTIRLFQFYLVENDRLDLGSGIQSYVALTYLASCQNGFITSILNEAYKLPFVNYFEREKIPINGANKNNIINVIDFDFEFYVRAYSKFNIENGRLIDVEFDYQKIQLAVANDLLVNKRLINVESVKKMQYFGEILSKSVIIDSVRNIITQSPLSEDKKSDVNKLLKELVDCKDYETIKSIYLSLETIICFLSSSLHQKSDVCFQCIRD